MFLSGRATAPVATVETRRFRITHPFHPYQGQEFSLIEDQGVGICRTLLFQDQRGHWQRIPAIWTDLGSQDAFTEVAAGRSALHADCLWSLTVLLEQRAGGRS